MDTFETRDAALNRFPNYPDRYGRSDRGARDDSRESPSGGVVPEDVLRSALGREVTVEGRNGATYRGTLRAYDHHMNLLLEGVTETSADGKQASRPSVTIRGDGLLFVRVG